MEFHSKLESLMPAEELMFDPTPGFGSFYKKYLSHAIAHPAKMNDKTLLYFTSEVSFMETNKGTPSFPKQNMTEPEKAWLACALDTDGHISITHLYGKLHNPIVGVSNTNKELVEKAASLIGVNVKNGRGTIKPMYVAVSQGRWACSIILPQVLPYLIIKRENAERVLEWVKSNFPEPRVNNILEAWERQGKRFGKVTLICKMCDNPFIVWKSRTKMFCSRRCYLNWRKQQSLKAN